jgi:mannose-6-phosphate isomerase-like protein (cupin superfamily)
MEVCEKPWGKYATVFEEEYCKVKQIVIKPGEAPSYQYHFKRSEVWVIVQGKGTVKIDDVVTECKVGDTITVPIQSKHQIKNTGTKDLVFIEVQLGESFEESDIVRVEDKYGRV